MTGFASSLCATSAARSFDLGRRPAGQRELEILALADILDVRYSPSDAGLR